MADCQEVLAKLGSQNTEQVNEGDSVSFTTHEQHYKDDLKSGAFQFVDGNAEELPFPYQVIKLFHSLFCIE